MESMLKMLNSRMEEYQNVELGAHGVSEIINSHARCIKFTVQEVSALISHLENGIAFDPVNDNPSLEFDEPMDGDHESALESAFGPNE